MGYLRLILSHYNGRGNFLEAYVLHNYVVVEGTPTSKDSNIQLFDFNRSLIKLHRLQG